MKLSGAEFLKELGVFLVSEAVGRNVVRGFADGFVEVGLPFFRGLVGDGEHEVQVDGREAGLSEDAQAFVGLVWGVDSAESAEGFRIP